MTTITDDYMKDRLEKTKEYTMVILKRGPNFKMGGVEKIIKEHGRRNFSLHEEGKLAIVCPVTDQSEVSGIGIFNISLEEVKTLMAGDPGVKEGVFIYEAHPCKGFPGTCLP